MYSFYIIYTDSSGSFYFEELQRYVNEQTCIEILCDVITIILDQEILHGSRHLHEQLYTSYSRVFCYRMGGCYVDGGGTACVSRHHRLLSAQVHEAHGGHGRPGHGTWMPLHLLRLTVPPAVL